MRQMDGSEGREIVGTWVRSERIGRGYSRAQFVRYLRERGVKGVTPSAVRWWEEWVSFPRPPVLALLLHVLEADPPTARRLVAARLCLDVRDLVELLSDSCGHWDVWE
jgi:DNA-binding transcriptional regulator YiaG